MNFDSVIVICLESEYYCLEKVGQLLLSLTAKIDFSETWLRFFYATDNKRLRITIVSFNFK